MIAKFYNEDRHLQVFSETNKNKYDESILELYLCTDETEKEGIDPHHFFLPVEDIPFLIDILKRVYDNYSLLNKIEKDKD